MALTFTTQEGRQRPWGYEVPLFVRDVNKKEHNIVMRFEKKPVEKEINDMVVFWIDKIKAEKEPVEDRMFFESEVLELLKSKNIIKDTIMSLESIPIKTITKGL